MFGDEHTTYENMETIVPFVFWKVAKKHTSIGFEMS